MAQNERFVVGLLTSRSELGNKNIGITEFHFFSVFIKMKKCCVCIPLRDGVTILGFLSLIICILEWVLTTAFKTDAHDNGNSINNIFRAKGDHIVSLITELANNEFNISVKEINDKTQFLFNCVTGESKMLEILVL